MTTQKIPTTPTDVPVQMLLSYHKQGDDFAAALKESKGDAAAALRLLADWLREDAKRCITMAKELEKQPASFADGGVHWITLNLDPQQAERLEKRELVAPYGEEDDEEPELQAL